MTDATTTKTTCQICARDIKAKTGLIAHHGYQRPGYGWQTESCMGAKYLPYEQSRDRIPAVLDAYKNFYITWEAQLKEFKANPPKEIKKLYISPYTGKRDESQDKVFQRPEGFSTVESLKIEKPSFYDQPYEREFNFQVYNMERQIRDIKETRDWLQKRYDDWKPQA
jgi:hypothetical protein